MKMRTISAVDVDALLRLRAAIMIGIVTYQMRLKIKMESIYQPNIGNHHIVCCST